MYIQRGLFVRIAQFDSPHAPRPLPLSSRFSTGVAYQVLGAFSPSETSEAYFILSNDADEIWFISNRHCRTHKLLPDCTQLRFSL